MSSVPRSFLQSVGEWLGVEPASELQLARLAEGGLPTEVVRRMSERGLSASELYTLVIPQRTLKHRRSRNEKLNRDESDRAVRTARVLALAQNVFGSEERALGWMRLPRRRFDGSTPFQMCVTGAGAQLVEEMLTQIDEGMFA